MTEPDLADLLREHAQRHRVPGSVVGVLRDGAATYACHGVANAGTRAPVTRESLFGAGSLTKSMVATVVARLADDGRLRLDDPIAAHLPELRGAAWAESATVRDLLANRSGLPLRAELEFDFAAQDGLSSFAAKVAAHKPTPVAWSYTNVGWCLLGRAVETATGLRWEDALRASLLEPAEMRETSFATEAVSADRVSGHASKSEGPAPVEPLVSRAFGPAGSSVVSTVGDMLRFAALHLDDPALARLRELQAEPRIDGWLDGWCLGWARFDWDGGPVWGWDSVLPGERAVLRLVPEQRAAVVLMANSDAGRALYRSLFGELFPSLFGIGVSPPPEAQAGAAGDLSRFAGVYGWEDRRLEVKPRDQRLLVDDVEALPVDDRVFLVDPRDPDNPTFTFDDPDDHGRPRVVYETLWASPRPRVMARLLYAAIASLDGYVEDPEGRFDWAAPGEEVHRFVNDVARNVGTHLYGRRMYETMVFWEDPPDPGRQMPAGQDFARIWQAADKIVYSTTLQAVSSARTRVERDFDPEAVRRLKATANRDLTIGGPELAAQAIGAGLVDDYHLFLVPVLVGGGKRAFPDGVRVELELVAERPFGNGTVYLHYRPRPEASS